MMINLDYAYSDQAAPTVAAALGNIPGRWGRMTPLCRAVTVEVGRLLQREGILKPGERCDHKNLTVGLVGVTRRGSILTDIAFDQTVAAGVGLASPALFGYTLPNIPLAEAASQFGLTGPVYALFETRDPLSAACREAETLMRFTGEISLMLACEFDHFEDERECEQLLVNLAVVTRNNGKSKSDISEVE